MILIKRVLWFKTIRYVTEAWPDLGQLTRQYSAIYITTYDKKDLPGWHLKQKDTPVVSLDKPLPDIFAKFNHTTRNEIRRTLGKKIAGLEIIVDDKNLKDNYELSKDFEYQQGRVPEPIQAYQGTKLFAAYYHNQIIASLICFDSPQVLRAKAICSKRLATDDRQLKKIISYATRRLVYEAIKYAHDNNYQLFDLGSVNSAKKNLAQFKMGFTHKLIKEYTYTYMSFWFKMFKRGVFLKKIIKKTLKF